MIFQTFKIFLIILLRTINSKEKSNMAVLLQSTDMVYPSEFFRVDELYSYVVCQSSSAGINNEMAIKS